MRRSKISHHAGLSLHIGRVIGYGEVTGQGMLDMGAAQEAVDRDRVQHISTATRAIEPSRCGAAL
jgi:hypothetical protein